MARTFGQDDEDDDERQGAYGGAPPGGADKCGNGNTPQFQPEEIQEEAAEGNYLYLEFFRSQIFREGIAEPPGLMDDVDMSPQRQMDWRRAGQELRQMADQFARSPERESVRLRAQKVSNDLESLDFDNFLRMLQELFLEGGVTRERILVLFFFCADIAMEALRRGFNRTFRQLIRWSLRYIGTRVAEWVHTNGGWGMVLRSSLNIAYQVTACCAFVAVVAACVVYIRRNI